MLAQKRGFTLIELLVVIAIIGVLSTIVMASLGNARAKGRDSRRISDIKQLQLALAIYYDANQMYPAALSSLVAPGYIPSLPKDPRTGVDYLYAALQGGGVCSSYHLGAVLEGASPTAPGSPFADDKDAAADSSICAGSGADFDGTNDATNKRYDVKP